MGTHLSELDKNIKAAKTCPFHLSDDYRQMMNGNRNVGPGPSSLSHNGHSDSQVLAEFKEWMAKKLPCVAGRRELNRGRYMIEVVGERSVPEIFESFKIALARKEAVACLMVFNAPEFYAGRASTSEAFYFLAEQMACLGHRSAHELANGEALTNSVNLKCPVTGQQAEFDDFECIAFCPQSLDEEDPLYDPLMGAPYPCVNISSDVFAFSTFVDDSAKTFLGHSVHEENDLTRIGQLFEKCIDRWQRVATTTINNFAEITNTSLCPVHLNKNQSHWAAAHKDPAFAEQEKIVHMHELPVVYGKRITDNWMEYLSGQSENYVATGMARDGLVA